MIILLHCLLFTIRCLFIRRLFSGLFTIDCLPFPNPCLPIYPPQEGRQAQSAIQNQQSSLLILNHQSEISNPQFSLLHSSIFNHKSAIVPSQSSIINPQSLLPNLPFRCMNRLPPVGLFLDSKIYIRRIYLQDKIVGVA